MNMGMRRAVLSRHMSGKDAIHRYPEHEYDREEMYGPNEVYGTTEARFRDRKGLEHYNNGRFAPKSEYDYPGAVPPVYKKTMNRIGFDYPMDANYHHTSGKHHDEMRSGKIEDTHTLTEEVAEEWMRGLHNADGTSGPHWSKEQVAQVVAQRKLDMSPLEAWVAMNMVYSDFCKVARANNVNTMDFYVAMAKAFVEDEDAKPDKLSLYYEYIVK